MAELRGEVRRLTALLERVGKATGAAPLPDTPDTPKPAALRRRSLRDQSSSAGRAADDDESVQGQLEA